MSDNGETSHHDYFGLSFSTFPSIYSQGSFTSPARDLHEFDHPSYTSFTHDSLNQSADDAALWSAFDVASSSSLVFNSGDGGPPAASETVVSSGTQVTTNASASSSSTEAAAEEDCKSEQQQLKGSDDGMETSNKKVNKPRTKGEKRQRQPRFAFMTKSEVDHLEDGYRWRKYGQKAVKNSPYPRSYYRCTTQKCTVKKRVERSFQDPTIVITTYEGQHTHQSPATVRGNSTGMLHSASLLTSPPPVHNFQQQELLMQPTPRNDVSMIRGDHTGTSSMYHLQNLTPLHHFQIPDYGLLQDIVPTFNQHQYQ